MLFFYSHTHAASLATPPVNSHKHISRELRCGRRLLATHLVIGSVIVFFFTAIFHFGSKAGVEAAWFMVRECAESFSRQTGADVSIRHRWDADWHLQVWISTWEYQQRKGEEGASEGREASRLNLLPSCGARCLWSPPFAYFFSLKVPPCWVLHAPLPAGSCLVLTAKWRSTVVCTEVCMNYMGRGWRGWRGKRRWGVGTQPGAPRGMPWKNETEECRLHWAV